MAVAMQLVIKTGGLCGSTIEWLHMPDHVKSLTRLRIPYIDFFRIVARPESYFVTGWDSANMWALLKLTDYEEDKTRALHYMPGKVEAIRLGAGESTYIIVIAVFDIVVKYHELCQTHQEVTLIGFRHHSPTSILPRILPHR